MIFDLVAQRVLFLSGEGKHKGVVGDFLTKDLVAS